MPRTPQKILQTHLYQPSALSKEPYPVTFKRSHPRCTSRSVRIDASLQRLSALGLSSAETDTLHQDYLAGSDHDATHLLYLVTEGSVWGISQDFQHLLQPGDLLVIPAGRAAWIELTEGSAKATWLHFFATEHWDFLKKEGPTVHPAQDVKGFGTIMELLIREQASQHPTRDTVARHYGEILATYIQKALHDQAEPSERLGQQQLHRLHEHLFEHLEDPWTVDQMAARCNMSGGHLHLLTKRNFQQTPMELLRKIRMEHAATQLMQTTQTIEQIAEQVGYGTAYAFSNAFKRHSGKRPGTYRQQMATERGPTEIHEAQ